MCVNITTTELVFSWERRNIFIHLKMYQKKETNQILNIVHGRSACLQETLLNLKGRCVF